LTAVPRQQILAAEPAFIHHISLVKSAATLCCIAGLGVWRQDVQGIGQ
jgi:hypothetical protein